MPRILAAASQPRDQRPSGLVTARIGAAGKILGALRRKSDFLSRSISSSDPLINEMLRVADISWRMRSDAGIDRHAIMSAILAEQPPSAEALQSQAEMKGRVATSWMVIKDDARLQEFPAGDESGRGQRQLALLHGFHGPAHQNHRSAGARQEGSAVRPAMGRAKQSRPGQHHGDRRDRLGPDGNLCHATAGGRASQFLLRHCLDAGVDRAGQLCRHLRDVAA